MKSAKTSSEQQRLLERQRRQQERSQYQGVYASPSNSKSESENSAFDRAYHEARTFEILKDSSGHAVPLDRRYQFLQLLGFGSYGIVFKGKRPTPGSSNDTAVYAVKMLFSERPVRTGSGSAYDNINSGSGGDPAPVSQSAYRELENLIYLREVGAREHDPVVSYSSHFIAQVGDSALKFLRAAKTRYDEQQRILGVGNPRKFPSPFYSLTPASLEHFIEMNFVEGTTMFDFMQKGAAGYMSSLRVNAYIVYSSFAALAFLHALDFIHRDIKPSNLQLLPPISNPRVLILDVGLGCFTSSDNSRDTCAGSVGTPVYFAPERLNRQSASTATKADIIWYDVYAMALSLHDWSLGDFDPDYGSPAQKAGVYRLAKPYIVRGASPQFFRGGPPAIEHLMSTVLQSQHPMQSDEALALAQNMMLALHLPY